MVSTILWSVNEERNLFHASGLRTVTATSASLPPSLIYVAYYGWHLGLESVAGPGGGGRGSGPPFLLGHDVGFLTLGPKLDPLLDPPPFFLLVDIRWTPVAEPGCVCVQG